ncbi:SpoIIE family protein phosphatase [Allostreptomyces psammosilenae]|uniref:SpoIIE family protein phosphatase n=1 Tax=Allostreptomyces psammosilenae TaxID=1892865 RepID=UPI0015C72614
MTAGTVPGTVADRDPAPRVVPLLPEQPAAAAVPGVPGGIGTVITARTRAVFEPVGRSVAAARSYVRDTLRGWAPEQVVDDAVVLTSELVTNAVVHAGTAAEVVCLRSPASVRVEVVDRHPERVVPARALTASDVDPDSEGGRGLMLCQALAASWGVEYAADRKCIWFRLDLPEQLPGTHSAGPRVEDALLPAVTAPVRVAVAQVDADCRVQRWNDDAAELSGRPAKEVIGLPFAELVAWPQTPGTGLGLVEALELSRWEGGYGLHTAGGPVIPVHAAHLRFRDDSGAPFTLCLMVQEVDRAVLTGVHRGGRPGAPAALGEAGAGTPEAVSEDLRDLGDAFSDLVATQTPEDLDGLLQRTVERARDVLDADAAFLLLATDDETELELRASTGLPPSPSRPTRIHAEPGIGRHGSARLPAVHDDLAAVPGSLPLLAGTGMRAAVTVPLKVEGRLTGTLGIASSTVGRWRNEDAMRLQYAAERVALAVESARLTDLERMRRGSLFFLVEASDLLAGTLDRDQTLALMAQMAVPTLAQWCALYTIGEHGEPALSFVLHEDEDRIDGIRALLRRIAPPEPLADPGARMWPEPAAAAREAAERLAAGAGQADPDGAPGTPAAAELAAARATAESVGGETAVVPLVARNRVIGMLVLGNPVGRRFRRELLELAEDLSRRAALGLDNARLYSERTAISQSLQRSLLPPELPTVPGVDAEVIYRAAGEGNEVGGDFYDLFRISEDRWGFAIGDVCGTGPEAAAVTGLARHALRLLSREGLSAPDVLTRLNSAILDQGPRSRFLTLLYGELLPQPDGGAELRLVCAGHPLPLRLRPDGTVEPAATPQPLLGVMDDLVLEEEVVRLDPGDVLLCVTDGVTERREGSRMLGDDGLAEVLSTAVGLTAGAVAGRVLRAVEDFAPDAPSDDMAILTLRLDT